MLNTIFITITLLLVSLIVNAQQEHRWIGKFYTQSDGLNSQAVKSIYQDQKRRIWVATPNGLHLYNGHEFKYFKREVGKSNSITSNYITSFVETSPTSVLVGTFREGLNLLNPLTEEITPIKELPFKGSSNIFSLKNFNMLVGFYDTSRNSVWTRSRGFIYQIHLDENKHPVSIERMNFEHLKTQVLELLNMYMDKDGDLWFIFNSEGVIKLKKGGDTFERVFRSKDSQKSFRVYDICQTKDGRLWLNTSKGLKLVADKESFEFTSVSDTPRFNQSSDFALEHDGKLWVQFWNGTIGIFDTEKMAYVDYYDFSKLKDGIEVLSLTKDNESGIWVGTSKGLGYYHKDLVQFKTVTRDNEFDLPTEEINRVHAHQGYIFLGHNQGLSVLDVREETAFHYAQDKTNHDVVLTAITADKEGNLWYGTNYNGFGRLTGQAPSPLSLEKILKPISKKRKVRDFVYKRIKDITFDKNGILWGATFNKGIIRYEPKTNYIENLKFEDGISSQWTTCISFDQNRNILWVGTSNQGLMQVNLDEKSEVTAIKSFKAEADHTERIGSNNIASIFVDKAGKTWVGTLGEGLYEIVDEETQRMKSYKRSGILSEEDILGISEDEQNNLWVAGKKGAYCINYKSQKVRTYKPFDKSAYTLFRSNGLVKDEDGNMLFASGQGLAYINTNTLTVGKNKPTLYFDKLYLDGLQVNVKDSLGGRILLPQPLNNTKELHLEANENDLGISFYALYFQEQDLSYEYMIEGYHKAWAPLEKGRRMIYCTGLPYGEYTLKVRAKGRNDIWSETAELALHIAPTWYENPVNRVLGLVALTLLSFLSVRWRIKALKQQKKHLERQVQERTQEISSQNEELRQMNEEVAAHRDHLSEKHKELEASYNDMNLIGQVGIKATRSLSIESLLESVNTDIKELIETSSFTIGVLNEVENLLYYYELKSDEENIIKSRKKLSCNTIEIQCFNEQEPICIHNYKNEVCQYKIDENESEETNQSMIFYPLQSKEKTLGFLIIKHVRANQYNNRHFTIVQALATYISTALDNSKAYNIIADKNIQITESIRYAKTIQESILPTTQFMEDTFGDYFVLFRPKDIVSGDFYWSATVDNRTYLICSDCTGHGVPGAFMSMIGNVLLNKYIKELKITSPADILIELHKGIQGALHQKTSDNEDGMDISVCKFEQQGKDTKLTFAGAKTKIYHKSQTEENIQTILGSRATVGGVDKRDKSNVFTDQTITLKSGDLLYLSTDGFIDQNNPERKRYGIKRFVNTLSEISTYSIDEQKKALTSSLEKHQQYASQRDDITVIGIEV